MVASRELRKQAEAGVKSCVVSLLDANDRHSGLGFLVGENRILTCAHVVAGAVGSEEVKYQETAPLQRISIRFPFLSPGTLYSTEIICWSPKLQDDSAGKVSDVALLQITGTCPDDPIPQIPIKCNALVGDHFFVWGESRTSGAMDVVEGTFTGGGGPHKIQMQRDPATNPALQFDNGFSGAPVWNTNRGGIVGLLTKAETQNQIGYCIPTPALLEFYPELTTRQPEPDMIQDYRARLSLMIDSEGSPCPKPEISFALEIEIAKDKTQSAECIFDWMRERGEGYAILTGAAGGGKSYAMGRVVRRLLDPSHSIIPVFVKLGAWKDRDSKDFDALSKSEPDNFARLVDVVFRNEKSLAPVSTDFLKQCAETHEIAVILDGLNELAQKELRENLLHVFDGYQQGQLTRPHRTYVLISDRKKYGHRAAFGAQISLNRMRTEEIQRIVDIHLGDGTFGSMDPRARQILDLPYFLNNAIENQITVVESYSGLIETFLKENIGLEDAHLKQIGNAAYQAYVETFRQSEALLFSAGSFGDLVDTALLQTLVDDRIIERVNSDRLKFDHQLKHDYFAALHLSKDQSLWTIDAFDAVSRDSSSPQVHVLVLEQLPRDSTIGDEFIERVYDWNWGIALECIASAHRIGNPCWSHEIELAIVAQVAEKKLDPVVPTAKRSDSALEEFDIEWIQPIRHIASRAELVEIVIKQAPSAIGWFETWKELFVIDNSEEVLDRNVLEQLTSEHSLLGWCSSNVLRLFPDLPEDTQRQVRCIYMTHASNSDHDRAVRWRAVHALGVFPNRKNTQLLSAAAMKDQYMWVRYGAVRSLVESAAICADQALRENIIADLVEQLPSYPKHVRSAIRRTVFHRRYSGDWLDSGRILLETLCDLARKEEKADSVERIETFVKGDWRS